MTRLQTDTEVPDDPAFGRPDGERTRKTTAAYTARRAEILTAAGEVFYEKSYHAASMQDIADRAGVLKPALYYYFRSKEDLLFELCAGERSRASIQQFLDTDAALQNETAVVRLKAFIECWMRSAEPRNPVYIAVEREYRQLRPERRTTVTAIRRQLPALLESILARGAEDGSFDAEINVPIAAMNISAMFTNMYVWYRSDGPCSIEQLTDWHIEFVLRGLGATQD